MMNVYQQIKEQFQQLKEWIMKHPKQSYKYVMILLILSFAFSFILTIYFTPSAPVGNSIPTMYSKSDEVKSQNNKQDKEMGIIVKELEEYKSKRENGPLSKTDSLRIEYLFNQYQNLKNGH